MRSNLALQSRAHLYCECRCSLHHEQRTGAPATWYELCGILLFATISSLQLIPTITLLATATHVVLMATSVVADILMLHHDDGVGVVSNPEHAVRNSVTLRYTPLIDRSTQHHPLSAAITQ